jgi:hypothetical protein
MHEGVIQGEKDLKIKHFPLLRKLQLDAYFNPHYANEIISKLRKPQIEEVFNKYNEVIHFCEVAYYFAPFVNSLYEVFPESKLVFIVRDGRYFVWSAYSADKPDPMPIGYVDHELSTHERNIAITRLRPKEGTKASEMWTYFSTFQKNCWLWSETNRIILEDVKNWPKDRVKIIQFENLFNNTEQIKVLLDFLDIDDIEPLDIKRILDKKINARKKRAIPPPQKWNRKLIEQFDEIAGPVMRCLGYDKF